MSKLQPKLLTTLRDYSKDKFTADLIAGLIVGIVALPLAIAFGIASGVTPDKGLVTAIIAGLLISALGGSKVQIGGPTGAFIVIVYGIVQKYGVDGLTVATIIAGVFLIAMGLAGLGGVIKFIPYPVIVGFTSGIAVIIFSSQIKDLLGLNIARLPADFVHKWEAYFLNIEFINIYAMGISALTLLIIIFWQKVTRKIPGSLVAIILSTFIVQYFRLPVETIGSRFGEIPSSIPHPHIPGIDFQTITNLIQPAFTIALLGAIESLLSATVADGMIGGKHRSNMELVAQGIANVASPLFGGIPATGAIARTATNVKNGGRTPVAGIIHAITLLLILLFFGQWAKLIPMACLAAILVIVAYNMSEWHSFVALMRSPRSDVVVLLITFLLTVILDLTIAIEIGLMLAILLFMRKMSLASNINYIKSEIEDKNGIPEENLGNIPKGIEIFEVNGPFFFGIAHKFEEAMRLIEKAPRVRIIRLKNVPFIDSTGIYSLKQFYKNCKSSHTHFILSDVNPANLEVIVKSGLYDAIGKKDYVFNNFQSALQRANELIAEKKK